MDSKGRRKNKAPDIGGNQNKALRTKHIDTLKVLSGYVDQNRELEVENRRLHKELLEKCKEINSTGMPSDYMNSIERELREMKAANQKYEAQMKGDIKLMQELKDAINIMKGESRKREREWNASMKSHDERVQTLTNSNDELSRRNQMLEDALKERSLEHTKMQLQCTSSGERVTELQALVRILEGKLANTENELALSHKVPPKVPKKKARPKSSSNKGREKELSTKLDLFSKQLSETLANLDQKTAACDKFKRRSEHLSKENMKLRSEIADHIRKNGTQSRTAMFAALDAQNLQLLEEKAALTRALEQEQKTVSQLMGELQTLRQQADRQREETSSANGPGKREMFQEYVKLKRDNEKMANIIAQLQRELGSSKSSNSRLRTKDAARSQKRHSGRGLPNTIRR